MQSTSTENYLSREDAYRLVWTIPLAVLAKKIGISGGNLATTSPRC
jgi:hypothetical protein